MQSIPPYKKLVCLLSPRTPAIQPDLPCDRPHVWLSATNTYLSCILAETRDHRPHMSAPIEDRTTSISWRADTSSHVYGSRSIPPSTTFYLRFFLFLKCPLYSNLVLGPRNLRTRPAFYVCIVFKRKCRKIFTRPHQLLEILQYLIFRNVGLIMYAASTRGRGHGVLDLCKVRCGDSNARKHPPHESKRTGLFVSCRLCAWQGAMEALKARTPHSIMHSALPLSVHFKM